MMSDRIKIWMMMSDRIKLAEAMGWKPMSSYTNVAGEVTRWRTPDGAMGQRIDDLPDPENDANDDYAVLEWMRAIEEEGLDRDLLHMQFASQLVHQYEYQIGDYARAALKVIAEVNDDESD